MNLLHLSPSLIPFWPPSSEAVVTVELAAAQRAAGHRVTVIAPAPVSDPTVLKPHNNLARRLSPVCVTDDQGGYQVGILEGQVEGTSVRLLLILPPESPVDRPFFDQAVRALVGELSERPEVVHIHGDTGIGVDRLRDELDGPAVIVSVYDDRVESETLRRAVMEADEVVVPCQALLAADGAGGEPEGLRAILGERAKAVRHGIDTPRWDPVLDASLVRNFGPGDLQGKAVCRLALQRRAGFAPRQDVPLLAVWSTSGTDSGLDQVGDLVDEILAVDVQLVVLCDRALHGDHPLKRAEIRGRPVWAAPDDPESTVRQVLGGADGLLLPDRYPTLGRRALCGLRYGLVPVARSAGVHQELLVEYDDQSGTGGAFLWGEPEATELLAALRRFCRVFRDHDAITAMATANASVSCGWGRATKLMGEIYQKALAR